MWAYAEASRKMKLAGGPEKYESALCVDAKNSMVPWLVVAGVAGWVLRSIFDLLLRSSKKSNSFDENGNNVTIWISDFKDEEYMCENEEALIMEAS